MINELLLKYVGFEIFCCCCGIGAASITFTSWGILLPFLFPVLKFTLFKSLFLSVLSDLTSTFFLTIVYSVNKQVEYKLCIYSFLQIPIVVGVSLYIGTSLNRFSTLIKNNINVLAYVIGFVYVLRFVVMMVTSILKKNAKIKKPPTKCLQKKFVFVKGGIQIVALIGCMIVTSLQSGYIKTSGGMNYNFVFQFFFGMDQKRATGTSCFFSCVVSLTLIVSIMFYPNIFDFELLVFSGLCIICSLIGAVIGICAILSFPKMYMFLFIGGICIILGTLPVIVNKL
jgi:hypothetical protein